MFTEEWAKDKTHPVFKKHKKIKYKKYRKERPALSPSATLLPESWELRVRVFLAPYRRTNNNKHQRFLTDRENTPFLQNNAIDIAIAIAAASSSCLFTQAPAISVFSDQQAW